MRRIIVVACAGAVMVLLSLPLWAWTRAQTCADAGFATERQAGEYCEQGKLLVPTGDLALLLTILGVVALGVARGLSIARRTGARRNVVASR
jgi:hypothetical protein